MSGFHLAQFNYARLAAPLDDPRSAGFRDNLERINALADRYRELLAASGAGLPPSAPGAGWRHAYHLFPILVPDRRRVFDALRTAGIGVQVHYTPIHQLTMYRRDAREFPAAERLADRLLSIPLFPGLTDDQQDVVVAAVLDAL